MLYKIQVTSSIAANRKAEFQVRYPLLEEAKDALISYITLGQGIVTLHRSFYEYQYDTKLNAYHKVDSTVIIGQIRNAFIENDKLFVTVDVNDTYNLDKKYICFYRATLQSEPHSTDRRLRITSLFAVDLIVILDNEIDQISELSIVEPYVQSDVDESGDL